MHDFHVCCTAWSMAEFAGFETAGGHRARIIFLRLEITAVLLHVLCRDEVRMAGRTNRCIR